MEIAIVVLLAVVLVVLIWGLFFRTQNDQGNTYEEHLEKLEIEKNQLLEDKIRLRADLENKSEELGKTLAVLEKERSEKDQLEGKGKQVFVENTRLSGELKSAREKGEESAQLLEKFKAREQQKEGEFAEKLKKLEHAQKALEDEKIRVRREDDERQEQVLEEKNRIWNDHETSALARLREVCEKPEIGFQYFDNQKLPGDFDARLKPDFLVEFLDQYVIFDAKKSKDPQTYILDQVKKTSAKCKGNDNIYSTIFFVMPDDEIDQLKKLSFFENGFSFFVISVVAIEPLLAGFKKITEYEKISEFDPKDRETIINLISNYDRHISFQNASNILLAKESVTLMNSKESLKPEMQKEIDIRKQSMRPVKLKDADLKNLSRNLSEQESEVQRLVSPKVAISQDDMAQAEQLFSSADV